MSKEHSMEAMGAAMKAVFEAMPVSAPETPGDQERSVCEYCGHARLNRTMVVTGGHWLCEDCDQDGDALKALTRALDLEETVMLRAIEQTHELLERARRYRAPLRNKTEHDAGSETLHDLYIPATNRCRAPGIAQLTYAEIVQIRANCNHVLRNKKE